VTAGRTKRPASTSARTRQWWVIGGTAAAAVAAGIVVWLTAGGPESVGTFTDPFPTEATGTDGPLSFEIRSADCGFDNVIGPGDRVSAEGKFCSITARVVNGSDAPAPLDLACQYLVTADRELYPIHDRATRIGVEQQPFDAGIPAGSEALVDLEFDVPKGVGSVAVELHGTCGSPGVALAANAPPTG
jgi:hypothetical protein